MLKEQKKRKRYKHSGFDGTTLICCAIGVVVSVNSCNFVNEKLQVQEKLPNELKLEFKVSQFKQKNW